MNTRATSGTVHLGDIVRPHAGFAWRPDCVVTAIQDSERHWLGRGFLATYPNGEAYLQWDGDGEHRFEHVEEVQGPWSVNLAHAWTEADRDNSTRWLAYERGLAGDTHAAWYELRVPGYDAAYTKGAEVRRKHNPDVPQRQAACA